MPTFQGQVTEEDVLQLIEYIKSLTPQAGRRRNAGRGDHRESQACHRRPPTVTL
jgi:hypothetical protein